MKQNKPHTTAMDSASLRLDFHAKKISFRVQQAIFNGVPPFFTTEYSYLRNRPIQMDFGIAVRYIISTMRNVFMRLIGRDRI